MQDILALYGPLLNGLRAVAPVDQQVSMLVDDAVKVWSRPGFDTFLSLESLRFTPFDYQLQAARGALRRMRGSSGGSRSPRPIVGPCSSSGCAAPGRSRPGGWRR
jgi:hypothetical protein